MSTLTVKYLFGKLHTHIIQTYKNVANNKNNITLMYSSIKFVKS